MSVKSELEAGAETPRYRHLTTQYLGGSGLDIGTGGFSPVVRHAIAVELPPEEFSRYTGGRIPAYPLHLTCGALTLPFKDKSLDFVYSSHLIEDFFEWIPPITEWTRVIKPGGHLVLLYPDARLWNEAIARGQPPNCDHRHESFVGEMTAFFAQYFNHFEVITDRLTALTPQDYSILFVARRIE